MFDSDDRDEFSVVEFYDDGYHRYVERGVGAEAAVKLSKLVVVSAERRPHVTRVIITDGGGFTVFEWQRGKGVTLPMFGIA